MIKVAFYEQNIFWADTTVWHIPLLYLNEFCPSYLINVIIVEPITLPIFSTYNTNLCLCFSTFGSFGPYPSYSPLFGCLIISAEAFSFEFSPIFHVLQCFICDPLLSLFLLTCYPFNISEFTLNCCHKSCAPFLPDNSNIYQTLPNFHFTPLFCDHTEMRCERIKW